MTSVPAAPSPAAPTSPDAVASRRRLLLTVLGVLALAGLTVVLALHELDRWAFWHDEAYSADVIRHTWDALLHFAEVHEVNMLSYYVLLKLWTAVSMTDAWFRALSIVFAALAVMACFGLARTLLEPRIAWLATALFAGNAFLLQYAQETRAYTLATLLAILSTWALVRAVRAPSRGRWVVYVLAAAVLPYTHVVLMAIYPVHAIAVLAARPRPAWRTLLLVGLAVIVLIAPALIVSAAQQGSVLAWVPRLDPHSPLGLWRRLSGMGGPGPIDRAAMAVGVDAVVSRLLPVLAGLLVLLGASATWRQPAMRWAGILLVSWLAVPVLAVTAVSFVKPLFVIRYLIWLLPAASMLVALGIAALPRPAWRAAALVAIVVLMANQTIGWYGSSPRPDWRDAAAWVVARSTRQDQAVYVGDGGRVLPYYGRQLGAEDRVPKTIHRADERIEAAPEQLAELGRVAALRHQTLWVVITQKPYPEPALDPRLAPIRQYMVLDETKRFPRLTIARFVPPPPTR
jgi:mannosyltransferase